MATDRASGARGTRTQGHGPSFVDEPRAPGARGTRGGGSPRAPRFPGWALGLVLGAALVPALLAADAGADEPFGATDIAVENPASPFQVTRLGPHTIALHRPRRAPGEAEGFVVDTSQLLETLKARVLEARGLGDVADIVPDSSDGGTEGTESPPASSEYYYEARHTFAPPFDRVTARLRLAPLGEADEGSLLNWLGWGLAAVIVAGLYALYRMVATRVAFAERRSNFASAVSHELKTPLTAIRMYAEMLQEDLVEDAAKRQEYYRTITAESERLSRLINNVLALSRIERRQSLPLRAANVAPVVREAAEVLRPHVSREGFELELELADDLPPVLFEADTVRQVVFNLIDNALKYSRDARDKRVTIEAKRAPEGGVHLSIRDRGPGVPPELLKTIFEPFFRAEQELTRKHKGSGIGLALVSGLAAAMRGRVTAHLVDPGAEWPGLEVRLHLVAAEPS